MINNKKRPLWARKIVEEIENLAALKRNFRESKRPNKFSSYVALMSKIMNSKPTSVSKALTSSIERCHEKRVSIHFEK